MRSVPKRRSTTQEDLTNEEKNYTTGKIGVLKPKPKPLIKKTPNGTTLMKFGKKLHKHNSKGK